MSPSLSIIVEYILFRPGKLQESLDAITMEMTNCRVAFETYQGDVSLEQATPYWGTEFFGGYRIGSGDFAVYDGKDKTNFRSYQVPSAL